MSEALSFYGAVLPGRPPAVQAERVPASFGEVTVFGLGDGHYAVAFAGSVQRLGPGEAAVIDHRALKTRDHREAVQAALAAFCEWHGLPRVKAHWLLACREGEGEALRDEARAVVRAVEGGLWTEAEEDARGEAGANVADALFEVARQLGALARAVTGPTGGHGENFFGVDGALIREKE